MRKGHHARRVEEGDLAQTVAGAACAHGVVEGEQARFQFGQRVAAYRTGEFGGKEVFLAGIHFDCQRTPFGVAQGGLEAFCQPLFGIGAHLEAVDHDFDGVLLVFVEFGDRIEFVHLAVDAHAHEALRAQFGKQIGVFALAADDQRRQDHQLGVFGQGQGGVDHLRDRLRGQRDAVFGALRVADAGIQQAQVIVDLGHRAHGRARVVAGRLLFDGDGRRQALDQVDVGLFHQLQELPRVGRQRLDIAALAFRVQGIEGERRLARARQTGDHDELVTRQIEVDVLEVVRACAAYADAVHGAGGVFRNLLI